MTNAAARIDAELISLGRQLHEAAIVSKNAIDAIPEHIALHEEVALIDAASASALTLAEKVCTLEAHSAAGRAVKDMASAWLFGNYWT